MKSRADIIIIIICNEHRIGIVMIAMKNLEMSLNKKSFAKESNPSIHRIKPNPKVNKMMPNYSRRNHVEI